MQVTTKPDNYSTSIKEQIQLKNAVQTKGIFGLKKRFAVLTNERLILFETKEDYLVKKNPRKSFNINEYEYITQGKELQIFQIVPNNKLKLIKKQWWETIKHFKSNNLPIWNEKQLARQSELYMNFITEKPKSGYKLEQIDTQGKFINDTCSVKPMRKKNGVKRSKNCSFEIIGTRRKNGSIDLSETNFNLSISPDRTTERLEDLVPISFKSKQKYSNENFNFSNSSFKINSEGPTKLQLVINNFSEKFTSHILDEKSQNEMKSDHRISHETNSNRNNIHIFQMNSREKYYNDNKFSKLNNFNEIDSYINNQKTSNVSKFNSLEIEDNKSYLPNNSLNNSNKLKETPKKNSIKTHKYQVKIRNLEDESDLFEQSLVGKYLYNSNKSKQKKEAERTESNSIRKGNNLNDNNTQNSDKVIDENNLDGLMLRNMTSEKNNKFSIIKEISNSSGNDDSNNSNVICKSKRSRVNSISYNQQEVASVNSENYRKSMKNNYTDKNNKESKVSSEKEISKKIIKSNILLSKPTLKNETNKTIKSNLKEGNSSITDQDNLGNSCSSSATNKGLEDSYKESFKNQNHFQLINNKKIVINRNHSEFSSKEKQVRLRKITNNEKENFDYDGQIVKRIHFDPIKDQNEGNPNDTEKSLEKKQLQSMDIAKEFSTFSDDLYLNQTNKDKKSLIEIIIENSYKEEVLINLSFSGQSCSNINSKLDMIISSVRQKTNNNEKFLLQIFEKLPLLLYSSINKVILSLMSMKNSFEFDEINILNILNIIMNDIEILIQTIPKLNFSENKTLQAEMNIKEQNFLKKMNRLKAYVANCRLRYEI